MQSALAASPKPVELSSKPVEPKPVEFETGECQDDPPEGVTVGTALSQRVRIHDPPEGVTVGTALSQRVRVRFHVPQPVLNWG